MSRLGIFLQSSIGKKLLMSITGLLLIGFLVAHVAGNLLLFTDQDGSNFDAYAKALEDNPLLPIAELGLAALFGAHIYLGLRTAYENREARKSRYKRVASHGNRTVSSVTMIVTGSVVLVFLIIHIIDFRLAERSPDGLSAMVVERLASPLGAAVYLLGVGALGVHLWHAFQSVFQSLGLHHPRYRPAIRMAGYGVAVLLGGGFALFPVLLFAKPDAWAQTHGGESASGAVLAAPAEAGAPPTETLQTQEERR